MCERAVAALAVDEAGNFLRSNVFEMASATCCGGNEAPAGEPFCRMESNLLQLWKAPAESKMQHTTTADLSVPTQVTLTPADLVARSRTVKPYTTTVIDGKGGISSEIRNDWLRLRAENPSLASPFFSPEFIQIVASARSDVEIAVVRKGGNVVAIFPFERRRWDLASPVGSFISDYNGMISQPDFALDPRSLLRGCGLKGWDFDHLPQTQVSFAPFWRGQHHSFIIDLSEGYEVYMWNRRQNGHRIHKEKQKIRMLERELGPLRFLIHSPDRVLLETLFEWKSAQYRRNGWRDVFSIPWVRRVVECVHAADTEDFSGMLSALYAGGKLVAVHLGMRSNKTCHCWFPAYDPQYSRYSPGITLLLKLAEEASASGVMTIDLGYGDHPYKSRFVSRFVPLARGSIECATTFTGRVRAKVLKLPSRIENFISKRPLGIVARCFCHGTWAGESEARI